MTQGTPSLVLFDGECSFCNGAVLFIIDRDPNARFVFAPLKSELGQQKLQEAGLTDPGFESMVLFEHDRVYTHSDASLHISKHLSGGWPLMATLLVLPRALRDYFYRAFAKRRYVFGRQDQCRVPTPDLRRRFVA